MSLESFYGGKQGISPVIRKAFKYIDANDPAYDAAIEAANNDRDKIAAINAETMEICFQNSNYQDVWYNELCIINTENKNNPNNGKLFRRTLKTVDQTPYQYSEYIGRIVGPAGNIPSIVIGDLGSVSAAKSVGYPDTTDVFFSTEQGFSRKQSDTLGVKSSGAPMLVPGKNGDTFNDKIKYSWFTVIPADTTEDTDGNLPSAIMYLGFEIPYPVFEVESETLDWHEKVLAQRSDNEEHPFYYKWKFSIPRGIRGNAAGYISIDKYGDFRNLCGPADATYVLRDWNSIFDDAHNESNPKLDFYNDRDHSDISDYESITPEDFHFLYDLSENDLANYANCPVITYHYFFYSIGEEPQEKIKKEAVFYLGQVPGIKDVNLSEDGKLTFIYDNLNSKTLPTKIKWIKTIQTDSETGEVLITYNDDTSYTFQIPYPQSLEIDNDGIIKVNFTAGDPITLKQKTGTDEEGNPILEDFAFNYVSSVDMDEETKVLSYQTSPNKEVTLLNDGEGINYIKKVQIDNRNHLVVLYASTQKRPVLTSVSNKDWPYEDQYGIPCCWMEEEYRPAEGKYYLIKNFEDNHTEIYDWNGADYRDSIGLLDEEVGQFWQDLGLVKNFLQGIRVKTQANYSYYPWEYVGLKVVKDKDQQHFLQDMLAPEFWTAKAIIEEDEEGNPVSGSEYETLKEYYEFLTKNFEEGTFAESTEGNLTPYYVVRVQNPYYAGKFGHYALNEENKYEIVEAKDENGQPLDGTYLYAPEINDGSLFFFDYDAGEWKYGGNFNERSSVDVLVKDNEISWVSGIDLSDNGAYLVTNTAKSSDKNMKLPKIWEEVD